eukprot:6093502-Prymnesium_polylepis.1
MIVEEVAALDAPRNWFQVFDTATIPPVEMHDRIGGDYVHEGRSAVRIVIKVEPFGAVLWLTFEALQWPLSSGPAAPRREWTVEEAAPRAVRGAQGLRAVAAPLHRQ